MGNETNEIVKAVNRTTHAVRALVRFLFIQLSAITLAFFVNEIGRLTQDQTLCNLGICPPNPFTQIIAGLIWITGVIWSSYAGWSELEKSNPHPQTMSDLFPHDEFRDNQSVNCRNCGVAFQGNETWCANCNSWR